MATLKVTKTRNRYAFDIIEGAPSIESRRMATSVIVKYEETIGEGCLRTYQKSNTIRHKSEISENIIDRFHFRECETVYANFRILDNRIHIYTIE